jgi:hypothetical protein
MAWQDVDDHDKLTEDMGTPPKAKKIKIKNNHLKGGKR